MLIRLLPLFFLVFFVQLHAQNTTNSPYSSYGFGEKGGIDHAVFTGLGNSMITYFDSTVLNFYNPATYNTLGTGQPLFSLGINTKLSLYAQSTSTELKTISIVDHFSMAFKIKEHFGLAFGLKPFARKGYSMTEKFALGADSVKYSYIGTGGTNQVFIGLSTNLIKYKSHTLSVGSNISYLFGASTNERRSQLTDESIGGVDWKSIRMNSLYYEFGAYFRETINKKHHFTLAAVIEPSQNLKATQDEYLFYGVVGDPEAYDTLFSQVGEEGKIHLPTATTLGFNYNFWFNSNRKNNSIRNSELGIHFSYSTTDWTKFSSTFINSSSLFASTKLSFGLQYTPEREFLENAVTSTFLEKIHYRLGYYQNSLPYSFEGEQLKDVGATIGFGIPILAQQSLSSINFGFSMGKRETSAANSFNEKYLGINFGIVLAPSNFDRWFRKRKLD